jgi:hypothetical protein
MTWVGVGMGIDLINCSDLKFYSQKIQEKGEKSNCGDIK